MSDWANKPVHQYMFVCWFYICYLPSDISRSRISHANIVGFSRLYCSILDTTAGVATFGFDPPIRPGGLSVPEMSSDTFYLIRQVNEIK